MERFQATEYGIGLRRSPAPTRRDEPLLAEIAKGLEPSRIVDFGVFRTSSQ